MIILPILTYIFPSKKVEGMYFLNLGVKGLKRDAYVMRELVV